MDIMVIGSGGREHAIIKKIRENKNVEKIYALPGNGGIAGDAEIVPIAAKEIEKIVEFAKVKQPDFIIVAPDDPLVLGLVDLLHKEGFKCFGPEARAAEIEGSKVFSKNFMKKYNIPTASYEVFNDPVEAIEYLTDTKYPVVVKADGLALGKGVIICENVLEAHRAVHSIMSDKIFGESGKRIVVEEFLCGEEVSVLAFTDGKTVIPMVSAMDHKRAFDNDEGLNTGGMGTIAPNPFYTEKIAAEAMENIFLPTVRGMLEEGRRFKGCLFFGLMITDEGAKVIEFNCRFGDPETQVVLPLLKTDLLDIMMAVENETLDKISIEFENKSACCVIAASGGYPENYITGFPVRLGNIAIHKSVTLYHAGTKLVEGELVSAGGRVFGVSAVGDSLQDAVDKAYSAVREIQFTKVYYRNDIGKKALNAIM